MRALLRIRDARVFLGGWTLSQFGDWAMIIVLAVWAKALTHSNASAGRRLKSRRGRVLSLDEINHVSAVADSLAFTVEQMARIDKTYQQAFPDS